MADPTNPFTIRIKEICAKGSKKLTLSDYEERNRLEWEAGLYWHETHGLHIPSDNIERCIQLGAQKTRKGKDVVAVVFVSNDIVKLEYVGPKTKNELYADSRFQLRKGVVVQKSRIIRIRPLIPTGWILNFTIEFDESILNEKDLIQANHNAGFLIGLGDWRPKFGRFKVEVV